MSETLPATARAELLAELLRWSVRTNDDLPQARYTFKRAAHNWAGAAVSAPPGSAAADSHPWK